MHAERTVYPIKSCRGTSLKTSDYNECGLLYDRRWMIIDAKSHAMMTARQVPRLLLIEPTVDAAVGVLRIRVPGSKEIHEIPIEPPADAERLTDLKVWSSVAMDGLVVSPVGGALHKALVAHVGRDVLLVVKGESVRPAGGPGIADRLKLPTKYGAPHTAFADAWPALFASTSSLDDLRGRIETADDVKVRSHATAGAETPELGRRAMDHGRVVVPDRALPAQCARVRRAAVGGGRLEQGPHRG